MITGNLFVSKEQGKNKSQICDFSRYFSCNLGKKLRCKCDCIGRNFEPWGVAVWALFFDEGEQQQSCLLGFWSLQVTFTRYSRGDTLTCRLGAWISVLVITWALRSQILVWPKMWPQPTPMIREYDPDCLWNGQHQRVWKRKDSFLRKAMWYVEWLCLSFLELCW